MGLPDGFLSYPYDSLYIQRRHRNSAAFLTHTHTAFFHTDFIQNSPSVMAFYFVLWQASDTDAPDTPSFSSDNNAAAGIPSTASFVEDTLPPSEKDVDTPVPLPPLVDDRLSTAAGARAEGVGMDDDIAAKDPLADTEPAEPTEAKKKAKKGLFGGISFKRLSSSSSSLSSSKGKMMTEVRRDRVASSVCRRRCSSTRSVGPLGLSVSLFLDAWL